MSRIRDRDTKPEMIVRKLVHAMGYRYRLHRKDLPGKPDMVLPKYQAVVFIHGCFWHKHECHLFKWPSTRRDFWKAKLTRNFQKDMEAMKALNLSGWKVCIIWECSLKGPLRNSKRVIDELSEWIISETEQLEISGLN